MKELLAQLSFKPKEGANNLYHKLYSQHNNYCIEVDFNQKKINYGDLIECGNATTQNFSHPENWVVLECVNRLLEKGYVPKTIILEKTYPSGHGHSGRLDICVNNDDGEYLLIECKTYGKEFNKELSNTKKDGGQLFTYFKFENKAKIIMLYASKLDGQSLVFQNEIIKIEDDYRTGSVKDFYDRWNKLTKDNGVFDDWVQPYDFVSRALALNDLVEIREADSSTIFNQFLEILRHNVVSDKPNAFNKIFTLFLCKVYDEKSKKSGDQLDFQWLEGEDDPVKFQLRLTDLYKNGMLKFLEKEVSDFSEEEFNNKFQHLKTHDKKILLDEMIKLRLEKNNEFAIKEVFDHQSFQENAKIVREVVELLQKYKLRYNKRQQYLSDFFELLLTTGLKQESGQFFTPVPIAQFVIKSLPFDQLVDEKLTKGTSGELMPFVMDYAAGSGHFLTESMHEMQRLLDKKSPEDYIEATAKKIRNWQDDPFNWAEKYVYGVEKDYRLVKVSKVGCYLHGDGLANVLLSDGLANFKHPEYKGVLNKIDKDFAQENKQFDVVISNPPYSVSSFKNASRDYYCADDFKLYDTLSDTSSEIECLFVERTKQLLKDGGMAGIILPSGILSNTGIYSKTREIILKYFRIIAIAELGKNTFMATGTNTVVLFLKRRSNYEHSNLKESVAQFFNNLQEVTMGSIENPISKYLSYAWDGVSFADYKTLLQKQPNDIITNHELYQDYQKIKAKDDSKRWEAILTLEQEKIFYFVLTYPQTMVLVKTGEKKAEKQFLGYEFSNRRGSEGIHPIQRGKSIDECTQLFDPDIFDNPQKASTYIYQAFKGELDSEIDNSLKNNVSRVQLVDLISFDRADFEKTISLTIKKKLRIESQWELRKITEVANIEYGTRIVKNKESGNLYPVYGGGGKTFEANSFNRENRHVISRFGMSAKCVRYVEGRFFLNDSGFTVSSKLESVDDGYLQIFLLQHQAHVYACGRGVAQKNIDFQRFNSLQMPIPPKDTQQKIIDEIEVLEQQQESITNLLDGFNNDIHDTYLLSKNNYKEAVVSKEIQIIGGGTPNTKKAEYWDGDIPWLSIVDFKENGRFVEFTEKKISAEGLKRSSAKYLDKGDLIISARGTVGALAQLKKPMTFNQSCYGIKAGENLTSGYLYFALMFEMGQFKSNAYGAIFDAITTRTFDLIKVPLPPLAEQQKIVKQIEKIEVEISKLEKKLEAIPAQKEAILKKYL